MAKKVEQFFNMAPKSTAALGESSNNDDFSKLTYNQCIELQYPIEKCNQLQTMNPSTYGGQGKPEMK